MKRQFKLILMLVVALLVIVGCSNNDEGKANNESNVVDNNNNTDKDSNREGKGEMNKGTLSLGETGLVVDELGDYEITPQSVEVFKERNGERPLNDDEVFMLIDYTIKNVGDVAFDESDILGIRLILENKEGSRTDEISNFDLNFVKNIMDTIEPGETYEGQMIFEPAESTEYTLHFGSALPEIEDAEWKFTEEDINKGN